MGEDDHRTPEEVMEEYDVNNDSRISWDEFWIAWNSEDDHDNHNHSTHEDNDENHSDHDDHDDHNHSTHDDDHDDHGDEMSFLMDMFNQSDADGDQLLNLTELETFMHELEELEDEHRDHHGIYGTITLHVEAEGDYGFALPHDVTLPVSYTHLTLPTTPYV